MAHLTSRITYMLELNIAEMRVLAKALGGRLKQEDIEEAEALDTRIAEMRVTLGEQHYREICKLKENLTKED